MKKVKKSSINKKGKLIITFLMILFMLVIGLFYFYPMMKLKEIDNSYHSIVKTIKSTSIYQKINDDYNSIGKIENNIILELDKKEDGEYFKIKGTDYYVYYKDIEKSNQKIEINDNYLDFKQNINTNGKTNFYQNGKLVLELDANVSLPIKEVDEEYYYVYYGNIFAIKKDEVNIIDNGDQTKEAEYISVVHYDKLYDESKETCEAKKCTTINNFKEQLDYLKQEGYYAITFDEYEKWLNEQIRLKEKAILLTSSNQDVIDKANEYDFNINMVNDNWTFLDTNKKTTKESTKDKIDRYIITTSIDIEKYKKIVLGENIYNSDLLNSNDLASSIPVLNYHFFYDSSLGEECNEQICLDTKDFEEQLKYLKDNGYKTLTIEEFRAWMYGEIELPKKSVLLTVDDGAMGTGKHNGNKLIPLLEKYDSYATLFLITGWWDIGNYISPNLDVQSHTNDMHTGNLCDATRGAQLLCSTKEQVIADLKKSIEITGSTTAFCFPFYAYDDASIQSVKEVGFKLAFIGGNYNASRESNKYKIPRYPISKDITLSEFINMIS